MSGIFGPINVHRPPPDDEYKQTLTRTNADNKLGVRFLYPEEEVDDCCYNSYTVIEIQILYVIAAVLWIIVCWWLELYAFADFVVWGLFLIPLIVFGIGFYNAGRITSSIENEMFGANYLSFGFLIVVVLINWKSPVDENADKTEFFKIVVTAFVLIMIGMIDIWLPKRELSILKHIRTILQTAALVLLATALYIYYRAHRLRITGN